MPRRAGSGWSWRGPATGSTLVRQGHFGLVAMQERVEMAGGRFQLDTRPGAGVVLRAEFRVPPAA